jgi:hypothetical protein
MPDTNPIRRRQSTTVDPGRTHIIERTGSRHTLRSHTRHPSREDLNLPSHKSKRVKGVSYTEIMYPDVDTAKEAFDQERREALRNRAPTPFLRDQRDDEDEDDDDDRAQAPVSRRGSNRTLRSRVSFDSTRSRRSGRTMQEMQSEFGSEDEGTIGAWEPGFGARDGIGSPSRGYEVFGLGRKKARHRKIHATMLKPALKSSTSRIRIDLGGGSSLQRPGPPQHDHVHHARHHSHEQNLPRIRRDKPLPSRPQSFINPIFGNIFQSTANISQSRPRPHDRDPGPSVSTSHLPLRDPHPHLHASRPQSQAGNRNARYFSAIAPSAVPFRSLFSSMTLDPSSSRLSRQQSQQSQRLLEPAEDLYGYLHLCRVPSWPDWPICGPTKSGGFWNTGRSKGFEQTGWEWRRRQQMAEANRMMRGLRSWEGADKNWDRRIMECRSLLV